MLRLSLSKVEIRLDGNKAIDVFYDGKDYKLFEEAVLDKNNTGAGCTFASSIASELVKDVQKLKLWQMLKHLFMNQLNNQMNLE